MNIYYTGIYSIYNIITEFFKISFCEEKLCLLFIIHLDKDLSNNINIIIIITYYITI